MTEDIKNRIAKIYALVKEGGTEGEKQAAQAALDRLMKKYNLSPEQLEDIHKNWYAITYATDMEHKLIAVLIHFLFDDSEQIKKEAYRTSYDKEALVRCKQIRVKLTYLDYVTLDSAYEYFRRHMKAQWKKHCAPEIKRCRTTKTRNAKRKELQNVFFNKYIIASNLVDRKLLKTVKISSKEMERLDKLRGLQGGSYNTQVQTGHLLNA